MVVIRRDASTSIRRILYHCDRPSRVYMIAQTKRHSQTRNPKHHLYIFLFFKSCSSVYGLDAVERDINRPGLDQLTQH